MAIELPVTLLFDHPNLESLVAFVVEQLPGYQRPYFLRIQRDMRITGTFKHQKVDYRSEGYDPSHRVAGDAGAGCSEANQRSAIDRRAESVLADE